MARLPALLDGRSEVKVAIVCPYAWDLPGGVQTHVGSLASELRNRGHDALIVAPRSRKAVSAHEGVALVGRTVAVPANGSVAPLAFGPGAAIGLRRVLQRFAPDVMHLHEPLIPSLSLLALLRVHTPSVGTFHAAAENSIGYSLGRRLLGRAARRLAIRTAVSDAARELIQRYLPGDYHLTPNGADVERFASAQPSELGSGRRVLFLGRLERRKGLEVLLQAMTSLRDLDVRLVVAGSGPQEKQMRALAGRLQLPVDFLGRVDDATKAGLFKRADVYCAPGLGGESFGIVLIEAMAAGTPVVCSDLPGFRAVGATSAMLVPPGDPGSLADAIKQVLGDDVLAGRMSKSGALIASGFDWKRLVGNVEGLYHRAIEQRSVHV